MPILELVILLWLAIGGLGIFVLSVFILSVFVGGLYDLYRCVADHRGETRRARGLCPRCGYDLRASRRYCPECGLPTTTTTTRRSLPHPHFLHN